MDPPPETPRALRCGEGHHPARAALGSASASCTEVVNGAALARPSGPPCAGHAAQLGGRLRRTLVLGQRGYQRIKVATTMQQAKVNIRTDALRVRLPRRAAAGALYRRYCGSLVLLRRKYIALAAPDSSVAGVMIQSECRYFRCSITRLVLVKLISMSLASAAAPSSASLRSVTGTSFRAERDRSRQVIE